MCLFPFLRDWKTYLQNSTCLSKALSQNFRPQKSHAWGGQKITKRTKNKTKTHLVIVFCLCWPPFLFCHFAAFWHLALLHLRFWRKKFSEFLFLANLNIGLPQFVDRVKNLSRFALCLLADLKCQGEKVIQRWKKKKRWFGELCKKRGGAMAVFRPTTKCGNL